MNVATGPSTTVALAGTRGFTVCDEDGRRVGRVECPMYGRSSGDPDALAVCTAGLLRHHHYVVPAATISRIDGTQSRIDLSVPVARLVRFL